MLSPITIKNTGVIPLKDAFPDDMVVSRFIIDFKGSGGGGDSYSFTPQKRVFIGATSNASPGSTGPTPHAYHNTWFYDATVGPTVVGAGTAIVADSIIDVDASGCEVALNVTALVGSIEVFIVPVLG